MRALGCPIVVIEGMLLSQREVGLRRRRTSVTPRNDSSFEPQRVAGCLGNAAVKGELAIGIRHPFPGSNRREAPWPQRCDMPLRHCQKGHAEEAAFARPPRL